MPVRRPLLGLALEQGTQVADRVRAVRAPELFAWTLTGDASFLIECKRPFSPKKVGKRIRQAYRQLYCDLKNAPPGSRAVIAVSLSKLVNAGDTFLEYSSESEASALLSRELERLAGASQASQRRLPSDIIGLLFHVMTPAVHRETRLMVLADQLNMEHRAGAGTEDRMAFQHLGEALMAIADQRGP